MDLSEKLVLSPIKELVTVAGKFCNEENPIGIINDAAIAIDGETIEWVGRAEDLPSKFDSYSRLDCSDLVMVPGLVDSHTHLVFAGERSQEFEEKIAGVPYMEIAKRGGGILATVEATRKASLEELVRTGLHRLGNALALGITTMEIKSGYGLNCETELKQLEATDMLAKLQPIEIVSTFLGAHEFPPEYRSEDKRKEYVDLVCNDMIPAVAEQGIAKFIDVFCERGVFDAEQSERILSTGKEFGLIPKIHADEFEPIGGTELAARMGAASADHLHVISDSGIEALKQSNTVATLLPATTFFLGEKEYAPANKLIQAGIPVALATDFNPGSSMTQNLMLTGSIAATQMRMKLEDVLRAITLNAAKALRMDETIGSIEAGKQADILGLNSANWRYMFYYFGMPQTAMVIKRGRIVYENSY